MLSTEPVIRRRGDLVVSHPFAHAKGWDAQCFPITEAVAEDRAGEGKNTGRGCRCSIREDKDPMPLCWTKLALPT